MLLGCVLCLLAFVSFTPVWLDSSKLVEDEAEAAVDVDVAVAALLRLHFQVVIIHISGQCVRESREERASTATCACRERERWERAARERERAVAERMPMSRQLAKSRLEAQHKNNAKKQTQQPEKEPGECRERYRREVVRWWRWKS